LRFFVGCSVDEGRRHLAPASWHIQLDEFLTGERTLRSDILGRLAAVIGYEIPPIRAGA
jgi:hypothetical protein